MADVAFSDLAALTSLQRADLLCTTDDSESGSEKSKKITMGTLQDFVMVTGSYIRPRFTYKDADEIYVDGGFYDVDGKYSAWASQLTLDIGSPSANTWYYLYADYSGITSGTALTSSEFLFSTTAPSWDHGKKGRYNGSNRGVFAVLTDESGNIKEFFHDGGSLVLHADSVTERSLAALSSWADVDCATSVPEIATRAKALIEGYAINSVAGDFYWRTNGQSGSTGHYVTTVNVQNSVALIDSVGVDVITDSSQIFEVKCTNNQQCAVYIDGWHLPAGM